jgi:hypothetical protein
MLLGLLGLGASTGCETLNGDLAAPWISPDCIQADDCLWSSTTSTSTLGGSVYVKNTNGAARFADCRFVSCGFLVDASLKTYGGAVCLSCPEVSIVRCCGYHCSAFYGQFADFYGSTGSPRRISQTGCLACNEDPTDPAGCGTFYHGLTGPPPTVEYSNDNFPQHNPASGTALFTDSGGQAATTASYVTVAKTRGSTAFENLVSPSMALSYSNLCNNTNSRGTIFGTTYGLTIDSCIFSGNSKDIGFSGTGASDTRLHAVTDCWFSDELPSAGDITGGFENTVGATETLICDHFPLLAGCPVPPVQPSGNSECVPREPAS